MTVATLRQWVRYAAEIMHPKTSCGNYPFLLDWPQFKPLCNALVEAAEAGESSAIQWELADEINTLLVAIRARQAEKFSTKPTVGQTSDVVNKPAEIREKEEALKALRKKVLKAAPMPTLLELPQPAKPKKQTPQVRNTASFFERGA